MLCKYKVKYNANFWGSRNGAGYVFAKSIEDARNKLEKRYGMVDHNNIKQSAIIGFEIKETDFIDVKM